VPLSTTQTLSQDLFEAFVVVFTHSFFLTSIPSTSSPSRSFAASESVPTSGEVTGGLGEATAAAPAIGAAEEAEGGLPTASGDASAATGDFLGCDDLRTKGSCWPLIFVNVLVE